MNTRSRGILWGVLGVAGILIIAGAIVFGVLGRRSIPSDAILVPRDVPTVQEALQQALPGTTIAIQPAAGTIEGPIEIATADITLMSSRGQAAFHSAGAQAALVINADSVVIKNFDISSEDTGIQMNATDCTIEDVAINAASIGIQLNSASRCILRSIETRGGQTGIDINDSNSVIVANVTIADVSRYGIRFRNSRNGSMNRLTLVGNSVGISFENGSNSNFVQAGRIDSCSTAGIEIHGSNDNTLADVTIDQSPVGIVLEGVTGNEIRDCRVRDASGTGILLKQAVQNRIVGSRLESGQGSGLDLTQSAENAILYNDIHGFADMGIGLARSDKNLILGNEIDSCATGLHIADSSAVQVLRNHVQRSELCGLIVSNGNSNRLLDNTISDGSLGIVIAGSSDNKLLRNSVKNATGAGIAMFDSPVSNHASENVVRSCGWGLALAGSAQDDVTYNLLSDNDIGALISLSAGGARLEGNTFSANDVGLRQQSDLSELDAQWTQLALNPPRAGGTAVPVLVNNVFENNAEYDIVNDTSTELLAAGNRWGEAASRDSTAATVTGDVSLETSAWKGTIAVGTDSDEVHVLLGRILELTLSNAGFHVVDLVGIASSSRLQQALDTSDVDLIWWSGLDSNAEPQTDGTSPVVLETPAIEGWRVVVSSRLAGSLEAMTTSALAAWWKQSGEPLRFAATSDLTQAEFDAFVRAYGLSDAVRSFTQADDLKQVETLLKLSTVDVAVVRSLKETLTLSGFQAIDDDLQTLEQEPISMVVQPSTLAKYPTVKAPLEDLAGRLTTQELHTLVSRVRLLQESPEDVAREFLESSRSTDNEEGG